MSTPNELSKGESKAFGLVFLPLILAAHRNAHAPEVSDVRTALVHWFDAVGVLGSNTQSLVLYEVDGEPGPPPSRSDAETWKYPASWFNEGSRFIRENAAEVAWALHNVWLNAAKSGGACKLSDLADCLTKFAAEWGVKLGNVERRSWWFEYPTPETVRLSERVLNLIHDLASSSKAVQLRQLVPAPRSTAGALLHAAGTRVEHAQRVTIVSQSVEHSAMAIPDMWVVPRSGDQPTLGFYGDDVLDGRFPLTRIVSPGAVRTYMRMVWASRRYGGLFDVNNMWPYETAEVLRSLGAAKPSGSAINDDRKGVEELLRVHVDRARAVSGKLITAEKPEPLISRYREGKRTLYAHSRLAEATWRKGDCAQVSKESLLRRPEELQIGLGLATVIRRRIHEAWASEHNAIRMPLAELIEAVGRTEAVRGHKGSARDEWERIAQVALADRYCAELRLDETAKEVVLTPHLQQFAALESVVTGAKVKKLAAAKSKLARGGQRKK